jgi:ABC-2 type transport system ATP-binding protein
MGSNDYMVRTENLSRYYGEVRALDNLNIYVHRGELFGIVGPDGAGKTTCLRILAGILKPSGGEAWVDGISVTEAPGDIKEHIAYMPQRFGLYGDLSVMENMLFYADLFRVPVKVRSERIDRLFEFSRLEPFKERRAAALSGGMKQKLALACALIHSPKLLLLDEPTNGVDPVSRREFWRILYDLLKDGISIVVSTAYLDEAERTHRVGFMVDGHMVRCGTPDEMKQQVPGRYFEIVVDDLARARQLLSEIPSVKGVNQFGEGLHVLVDEDGDADTLEEALRSSNAAVNSVRPIEPLMEDVFMALMQQQESQKDRPA